MKYKRIKITALIAGLIVSCLTLTACDPGSYHFAQEDLSDVVSVQLINYDNPAQKHFASWVPDHSADLKPFDTSKQTVLETLLDSYVISDFIDELCEFDILHTYYAYDSPVGLCIKLTYSNGDFLIITSNYKTHSFSGYIGIFTAEGKVKQFIGCFSSYDYYETLVNSYFQTHI